MTRVLAVDYGRSRVGLAVSDPMGRTAQPLEVVQRPKRGSLVDAVVEVVRRVGAEQIVVGLPLRLDGTEGVAAEATRSFGRALSERSGLPVSFWDERFTTVEASRGMRSAGVSSRRQRGTVDKVAAAVLLMAYLESIASSDDIDPEVPPEPVDEPRRDARRRVPGKAGAPRSVRRQPRARRGWREEIQE